MMGGEGGEVECGREVVEDGKEGYKHHDTLPPDFYLRVSQNLKKREDKETRKEMDELDVYN